MWGRNIKDAIALFARKLCNHIVSLLLLIALLAIFDLAMLNLLTGCCEPGGACIPDKLYPQCRPIHEMSMEEWRK